MFLETFLRPKNIAIMTVRAIPIHTFIRTEEAAG